jgi:hypothetical protein
VAVAVVLTRMVQAEMGVLEAVVLVMVIILLKQEVQLTLVAVAVELELMEAELATLVQLEVLE